MQEDLDRAPAQEETPPDYLYRVHPSDTAMELAAKINTNFARLGGKLEPLAGADAAPIRNPNPNPPGVSHLEETLDDQRGRMAQPSPAAGRIVQGPAQTRSYGQEVAKNPQESADARERLGLA